MCGFVRGVAAVLVDNGAKHLRPLQYHFDDVLISVVPRARPDVPIQDKYIQSILTQQETKKETASFRIDETRNVAVKK